MQERMVESLDCYWVVRHEPHCCGNVSKLVGMMDPSEFQQTCEVMEEWEEHVIPDPDGEVYSQLSF